MFDHGDNDHDYPTLYFVERDVLVDTSRLFPPSGVRRDELPLWVKSFGLQLEPWMRASLPGFDAPMEAGWQ